MYNKLTFIQKKRAKQQPEDLKIIQKILLWLKIAVQNIVPSWFSCVMGTGILAIVFAGAPIQLSFFPTLSNLLWLLSVFLLTCLFILWGLHALYHPQRIKDTLQHPTRAQQWGIPPMACFTVASGFLTIGDGMLYIPLCIVIAKVLWVMGLAGALFTMLFVPYLMFTQNKLTTETTYGNWLTSVVPPIGASVSGALLIPEWPKFLQTDMLVLCYALWGGGVALAAITIVLFYARLVYHKIPGGALVPTMWLVIGPMGQSVTGINSLGDVAHYTLPVLGKALDAAALVYGLTVWGMGIYWLCISIFVTLRAVRIHLPFDLSWWAFIYPVGVLTTATHTLFEHTHTLLFKFCGITLLCLLTCLWLLVSARTISHMRTYLHVK